MPASVFTIANQKGGVGKTTTAVNLAVALARRRIPTLLIDLDPQANATSGLGFEKSPGGSLYPVLHDDDEVTGKVVHTGQKHLYLIPSEMDLAATEIELAQKENYLVQLRQALEPLREDNTYRVILIDCPPALGMLSMNSLAAADYLLVTLQCEYLAMEGLGQILNVVEQLKEAANPELEVGGIIMTMYDMRTNLSRQVVEEVQEHFSSMVFKTVIPRSVRLSEAPSFGQSIFEYDANSAGALAYEKLGRELISRFRIRR